MPLPNYALCQVEVFFLQNGYRRFIICETLSMHFYDIRSISLIKRVHLDLKKTHTLSLNLMMIRVKVI